DRLREERDALAQELHAVRSAQAQFRSQRGGELVHVPRSTSVVMWKPRRRRSSESERKFSRLGPRIHVIEYGVFRHRWWYPAKAKAAMRILSFKKFALP